MIKEILNEDFPEVNKIATKREKILSAATKIILGDREDDYGGMENNFTTIANLWSEYLKTKITPVDVSMMMVLLKVARVRTGTGKEDNYIDIAGYAACGAECAESMLL